MIEFFKRSNAFHIPVLAIITLVLKIVFVTNPVKIEPPSSGGMLDIFLYDLLATKVSYPLLAFIAMLIIYLSALYINQILNSRRMFLRSNMLTALCMIIFTSLFVSGLYLHAGVVLLPVSVWLYQHMIKLYNSQNPRTILVNMGFIVGTATLLYHPYWWMLPLCFMALAQMRPFKLPEWILLLLSFLTPAYFLLSYEFMVDQWNPAAHWPVWNPIRQWPALNYWWVGAIALAGIWVLLGISNWQKESRRMLIQGRKNWYLLLLMGLFMIPTMFFPKDNVTEGLVQLSFPASALAAHTFSSEETKWTHKVFFWILIIACGVIGWGVLQGKM